MISVEEFADGIVQINHRGIWDSETWQSAYDLILPIIKQRGKRVYLLFNLSATTNIDEHTFQAFLATPEFAETGLTVLVARRAHLKLARDISSQMPERDRVAVRLMPRLQDAFRVMLDKQLMHRIDSMQEYRS